MGIYQCNDCVERPTFATHSDYKTHKRCYHQKSVVVDDLTVDRGSDGDFSCPLCDGFTPQKNPLALRNHLKDAHKSPVITVAGAANSPLSSAPPATAQPVIAPPITAPPANARPVVDPTAASRGHALSGRLIPASLRVSTASTSREAFKAGPGRPPAPSAPPIDTWTSRTRPRACLSSSDSETDETPAKVPTTLPAKLPTAPTVKQSTAPVVRPATPPLAKPSTTLPAAPSAPSPVQPRRNSTVDLSDDSTEVTLDDARAARQVFSGSSDLDSDDGEDDAYAAQRQRSASPTGHEMPAPSSIRSFVPATHSNSSPVDFEQPRGLDHGFLNAEAGSSLSPGHAAESAPLAAVLRGQRHPSSSVGLSLRPSSSSGALQASAFSRAATSPSHRRSNVAYSVASTKKQLHSEQGVIVGQFFVPGAYHVSSGPGKGLVTTKKLAEEQIFVNDVVRLAICLDGNCVKGIKEAKIISRIKNHRDRRSLPKAEQQLLKNDLDTLFEASPFKEDVPHHDPMRDARAPLPVVAGLPLYEDGFCCDHCGASGRLVNFKHNHRRTSTECRSATFTARVIQPFQPQRYIVVDPPSTSMPATAAPSDLDAALAALLTKEHAEVMSTIRHVDTMSEDTSDANMFNRLLKWYPNFLKYRSMSELVASIQLPGKAGRSSSYLVHHQDHVEYLVMDYIHDSGTSNHLWVFAFCRDIGKGDGNFVSGSDRVDHGTDQARPFQPKLQANTLKKYAISLTRLVAQVLRTSPDPDDYLPPRAERLAREPAHFKFKPACKSALGPTEAAPDVMLFEDFMFTELQLEAAASARQALRDELETLAHPHAQRSAAAGNAARDRSRRALLALLSSVFLRDIAHAQPAVGDCALQRFVMSLALNPKGGGYVSAVVLSPQLAAVEFGVRLVALFAIAAASTSGMGESAQTKDILRLVSAKDGERTSFALLRQTVYVVRAVVKTLPEVVKVEWMPVTTAAQWSHGAALVDDKAVSVHDLQQGISQIYNLAEEAAKDLRLGVVDDSSLALDLTGVSSHSHMSTGVGQCLLDCPDNLRALGFDPAKHSLMPCLAAHGRLREFFSVSPLSMADRIVYDPNKVAIERYLAGSRRLLKLLFQLIHFTSIAARGTESASQLLRKTPDGLSCLRILEGALAIETTKNKTGDKPIVRFLSPAVSRLLLRYLLVIRPLEIMLVQHLHGEDKSKISATSLWINKHGNAFSAQDVYAAVREAGTTYFNCTLTSRDFRQFWAAMLFRFFQVEIKIGGDNGKGKRRAGDDDGEDNDADVDDAFALQAGFAQQFGHSHATHNHEYGVSADVASYARSGKSQGWRVIAGLLHRLLNIESVATPAVLPVTEAARGKRRAEDPPADGHPSAPKSNVRAIESQKQHPAEMPSRAPASAQPEGVPWAPAPSAAAAPALELDASAPPPAPESARTSILPTQESVRPSNKAKRPPPTDDPSAAAARPTQRLRREVVAAADGASSRSSAGQGRLDQVFVHEPPPAQSQPSQHQPAPSQTRRVAPPAPARPLVPASRQAPPDVTRMSSLGRGPTPRPPVPEQAFSSTSAESFTPPDTSTDPLEQPPASRTSAPVLALPSQRPPQTTSASGRGRSVGAAPPAISLLSAWVLPAFLSGLKEPSWTSQGQKDAMEAIIRADRDVVVVLPTGSGKTVLGLGPVLLDNEIQRVPRLTIYVTPSHVLKQEMVTRCQAAGIVSHSYPVTDPSTGGFKRSALGLQGVLIVSAEAICKNDFLTFLDGAHLSRIIVDEAHMFISDRHYRPALSRVGLIRRKPVPLVLLTATLPPAMLAPLSNLLNTTLDPADNVVRVSAFRRNISLDVITVRDTDGSNPEDEVKEALDKLGPVVSAFCTKFKLSPSKAIVFCKSKADVATVTEALAAPGCASTGKVASYCSPSSVARKVHAAKRQPTKEEARDNKSLDDDLGYLANLARFQDKTDSTLRVLVSTTGLLQAMDNPNIRLVVFFGKPYTFVDFFQGVGRAGRTNLPSHALVIHIPSDGWPSIQAPSDPVWTLPPSTACIVQHGLAILDGTGESTKPCKDLYPSGSALHCGGCVRPGVTATPQHVIQRFTASAGAGPVPPPTVAAGQPAAGRDHLAELVQSHAPCFKEPSLASAVVAAAHATQRSYLRNQALFDALRSRLPELKSVCFWCTYATPTDSSTPAFKTHPLHWHTCNAMALCSRCLRMPSRGEDPEIQCKVKPNGHYLSCGITREHFTKGEKRPTLDSSADGCFICYCPLSLHAAGAFGQKCDLLKDGILIACHTFFHKSAMQPRLRALQSKLPAVLLQKVQTFDDWLATTHPSYALPNAVLLFLEIVGSNYPKPHLPPLEALEAEYLALNNRV